jgi:hypothetical protein
VSSLLKEVSIQRALGTCNYFGLTKESLTNVYQNANERASKEGVPITEDIFIKVLTAVCTSWSEPEGWDASVTNSDERRLARIIESLLTNT